MRGALRSRAGMRPCSRKEGSTRGFTPCRESARMSMAGKFDYVYQGEEEKLTAAYDKKLLKSLLSYARPYFARICLCLLAIVIVSACELFAPQIIRAAIDYALAPAAGSGAPLDSRITTLWLLGGALAGTVLVRLLLGAFEAYEIQRITQHALNALRSDVFTHVLKLPLSFFNANPVGRIVTRLTSDIQSISDFFSVALLAFFRDIALIIGSFALMFHLHARLTAYLFVVLIVIAVSVLYYRKIARAVFRELRRKIAKLNGFLQESLTGVSTIQLFGYEGTSSNTFQSIANEEYQSTLTELKLHSFFRPFIRGISILADVLIILAGGKLVIEGELSIGSLVAFLSYNNLFFSPLNDLAEKYGVLQSAMASSERLFLLLNEPVEPSGRKSLGAGSSGLEIEFRNVWFAYRGEDWVLKDISFRLEANQSLALVGPTGAGKSSIVGLLLGLYKKQRGEILVGGIEIDEIDKEALRGVMAFVQQDLFLFQGTLAENVTLEFVGNDQTAAIPISQDSNLAQLLGRLPLKAKISSKAGTLSVGEKQLLSMARALYRTPRILILDEATAHIDSITESLLQDALSQLEGKLTSVVIAHRLSTIKESDQILVINHGSIVEQGHHSELLAAAGLYAAMYKLQMAQAA
ncbi:MAG: ABC transporter ATP-binding protein [Proteobacteria bacterium]|nr:MAG: ABC transporter ATP-binding protein [Pseudomonadota bacterium]